MQYPNQDLRAPGRDVQEYACKALASFCRADADNYLRLKRLSGCVDAIQNARDRFRANELGFKEANGLRELVLGAKAPTGGGKRRALGGMCRHVFADLRFGAICAMCDDGLGRKCDCGCSFGLRCVGGRYC